MPRPARPHRRGHGLLGGHRLLAVLAVAVAMLPLRAAVAHDMPDEFVLDTFVKPEGDRLHLLVRAPLSMLLDMGLPKRGPGYVDFAQREQLAEALDASAIALAGQIRLFEDGRALPPDAHRARLSVPADRAFFSYSDALAHIAGPPLPEDTNLFWNQGWFDAHYEYAIDAAGSRFALQMGADPGLARRLHVLVAFMPPDGRVLRYDILGDAGRVSLDPGLVEAARLFARAGWWQMVTGWEHLLFLFLLVLPFRRTVRRVGIVVGPFAAACAVAGLPVVAAGLADERWWATLADTAVAVSILALAIGNVLSPDPRWRWLVAGVLGLAHGAVLSTGLREVLQFGGPAVAVSSAAFVVGVYAAIGAAAAGMVGVTRVLFRHGGIARHGVLVTALLAGHQAWHWTVERFDVLTLLPPPHVDLVTLARRIVVVLLAGAAMWLLYEVAAARKQAPPRAAATRATVGRPESDGGPSRASAAGTGEAGPLPVGAGGREDTAASP